MAEGRDHNARARVLFVAALTPMASGGHGGQLTAAMSLTNSELARHADIVPLSSTMKSIPAPPLSVRTWLASFRMIEFARLLRTVDVALVFAADGLSLVEKGAMCIAARLAGRGVVVRFSSGNLPAQCDANPTLKRWLRLVLRSAHVVISQGPKWTGYFNSYPEAAGKVVEIPNSAVLGPVATSQPGRTRILFVGWMHREKGIFDLLDAAALVHEQWPTAQFDFVGGGRDLEEFQAEVARRGMTSTVQAHGWMTHDRTLELLTAADLFALPSYYEGLPNALLEAMAAGLPIVATSVGGIPDVVRDGDNGLLVPVGAPSALAVAIISLLSDSELARRLGAKARRTIAEGHDIERLWIRYADALDRACREAGRDVALAAD